MSENQEKKDPQEVPETRPAPAYVAPTNAPQPAPVIFMGFTLWQAIFMLFWPLSIAAAGWYFVLAPRLDAIEYGLKRRPMIQVVDIYKRVSDQVEEGKDAKAAVHAIQNEFRQLSAQGVIVLPADSVMAAPDEVSH